MPEVQPPSRPAASPFKLALAAVLTAVFVVVVIVQFGGAADTDGAAPPTDTKAPRGRRSGQKAGAGTTQPGPEPETADRSPSRWSAPALADVLKHDPFATPEAFRNRPDSAPADVSADRQKKALAREQELARKRAEQDRTLAELRQQGVRAVLGTDRHGNVAVVGSRAVRVGDDLDGFRVIAVEPQGVELQKPPIE